MRRFVWTAGLLAAFAGTAGADTQIILGKVLIVKDPQPGVDPSLRKITAKAKEPGSPDIVTGDPVTNGGDVQIIANGTNPSQETYMLPPGALPPGGTTGWTAIGDPVIGYQYKDITGVNGPVKILLLKKTPAPDNIFLLKVILQGKTGNAINVLPPNVGTDGGAIVTLGGGDSYCVALGGAAGGQAKNTANKVFAVKANDTAPAVENGCPALVLP
jgi:hypothetical protein